VQDSGSAAGEIRRVGDVGLLRATPQDREFSRAGTLEQRIKISSSVKHSHDENRFGLGPVNHDIGTDWPKQYRLAGMHVDPFVTLSGKPGKKMERHFQPLYHSIGSLAIVSGNVVPDG
jgi:hypothetical protein